MSAPALGIALPLAGSNEDPSAFVAELLDEVRAADAAGFDLCLVPEHHHGPRTSIVAPLALSAAIAAVTSRIRVGPGVLVLPVHHPLHVAEQLTMIDQLAPGRAVLGVGTGYQADDFVPFGVPRGERGRRMDAALDELERLLGHGDDAITPPPSSRPPVWIGAWSDVGLARAARRDGWIADPIRTVAAVADMAGRFRELGDGSGSVIVMREAWVDDAPGAADRFAEVIAPVFRYYRRNGAADLPEDPGELAEDRFVVGSAASCVEQVADIGRRTGADVVVLTLRQPRGPSHDTVMHAIDALGRARAEVAA